MMFFIFFVIACIIIIPISLSKTKNKIRKEGNYIFENYISSHGLTVTKEIDIPSYVGSSKFFIDDVNKTANLISYNSKDSKNVELKQIPYKDVLKCEVIRDDTKVLVEDAFSLNDRLKQKEYVKKLGFRVTFNDLSFPYLDILFINSLSGQTLTGLGHIVNSLNEWVSIMNIVIERGKINNYN
ncbi:hypothetical protein EXN65_16090 [Clostridium botulinum]|uniref:hypothetical protein n=1 Tax=Clostridium botulinum TaxID=1491 RepID=UPI000957AA4E|nr:hypothetical protein [Clostridium botulinum]APU61250.1 hypothetical protein NPD8_3209 [Clostridium botulinum]NEZ85852.1 hypothetical protein [Clostridium botulinum]NFE31945.1 hypothetical protein [Clostridium botulinum]WCJ72025.1 hypothetical protein MHB86_002368 [Clostridium botulinum]WCJ75864.1 hypothetical protein MHI66_002368 [Clostridium botulinum]